MRLPQDGDVWKDDYNSHFVVVKDGFNHPHQGTTKALDFISKAKEMFGLHFCYWSPIERCQDIAHQTNCVEYVGSILNDYEDDWSDE